MVKQHWWKDPAAKNKLLAASALIFGLATTLVKAWGFVLHGSNQDLIACLCALAVSLLAAVLWSLASDRQALEKLVDSLIENVVGIRTVSRLNDSVRVKTFEYLDRQSDVHKRNSEDPVFCGVANWIGNEQQIVLKSLADGLVSVNFGLGVDVHCEIMEAVWTTDHYCQMDAVSYDELLFWRRIGANAHTIPKERFQVDVGRRYYEAVREFSLTRKKTVLTRIFVLPWQDSDIPAYSKLLATVLHQHLDHGVGIAVVFEQNLTQRIKKLKQDGDAYPRRDFSLLRNSGIDLAATFFGRDHDRFQAIFANSSPQAIEMQRKLHEALVVGTVIVDSNFLSALESSYGSDGVKRITKRVADAREQLKSQPSDPQIVTGFPNRNSISYTVVSQNCSQDELEQTIREAFSYSSLLLGVVDIEWTDTAKANESP